MDDTINISINRGFIERLIYWIIIIVLAGLLIWQVLKDDCQVTKTESGTKTTETTTTTAPAVDTTPPPAAAPTASCVDGIKNQDETDIDCGGSCTKCATTHICKVNADCISAVCYNSTCVADKPVTLSGKVELDMTKAIVAAAPNGAKKVNGISYTIKNGASDDHSSFIAKVYIKNTAGTRCYNQQTPGTCDDSYAEFTISGLKSGKSLTEDHTFANDEYTTKVGRYIVDDNSDNPSQFNVVLYLYDENGNEIDGKSIIDTVKVG